MRRYYKKSQKIIEAIHYVLDVVEGSISTRQMYYQMVSMGVIPPTDAGYMKIQRLLVDLRRSGDVPNYRICDRTRNKHHRPGWDGLSDILESCKIQYRRNYWSDQNTAVYIAVEKQALEGVFSEVCDNYGVGLFVLRGYPSYSLLFDWSQEIIKLREIGKEVKIFYFGDFDATGVHIDKSVAGQIFGFVLPELVDCIDVDFNLMDGLDGLTFKRVGVLPEDIDKFNLLTLPVKKTDTRAKAFIEQYGTRCVELDALPPNELKRRIRIAIEQNIDADKWERMERIETQERITLEKVVENIGGV